MQGLRVRIDNTEMCSGLWGFATCSGGSQVAKAAQLQRLPWMSPGVARTGKRKHLPACPSLACMLLGWPKAFGLYKDDMCLMMYHAELSCCRSILSCNMSRQAQRLQKCMHAQFLIFSLSSQEQACSRLHSYHGPGFQTAEAGGCATKGAGHVGSSHVRLTDGD